MLHEIRAVRRNAGEPRRRWFVDDSLELTVWQRPDGGLASFQLAYDKPFAERLLSWRAGAGFRHDRVDDGEAVGVRHKRAPILAADGPVPWSRLVATLSRRAGAMDPAVRDAVLACLRQGCA